MNTSNKIKNAKCKNVDFFNLEKMRFIIKDAVNLDIDYAFEDLVFPENGIFIIQFDKKNKDACYCWFNNECSDIDRHSIFKSLTTTALLNNMKITYKGTFEMKQKENSNDQISIQFKVAFMMDK